MKAVINSWTDGDSGEMVGSDGRRRRFRLSNVSAPEKHEPGYNMATSRSKRLIGGQDVVDVNVVGKDAYGRDLVEVSKSGINVNRILEIKNKLFGIKPTKQPQKNKRAARRKTSRRNK
jgi:endonuclease YncB( thermonuclease family)